MVAVMSMIVAKTDSLESEEFKEIAAITVVSGQSVEVKDSLGASQVKGHVEQFNGNTFISYEWEYPTDKVQGRYQCTVHGMDRRGHPLVITSELGIEEKTVDLETALINLQGCEKTNDRLKSQLQKMSAQLNTTDFELARVKEEAAQLTISLNTTDYELARVKQEAAQLTISLNNSQTDLLMVNKTFKDILKLIGDQKHFTFYNNHFYFLSEVQSTIDIQAFQQKCQESLGYLVEINDQSEFEALRDFILGFNDIYHDIYIGITDEGHEGRWTYLTSGADVTFNKWMSGQPDTGTSENCAVWSSVDTDPGLADWICVGTHACRYMCEVNL